MGIQALRARNGSALRQGIGLLLPMLLLLWSPHTLADEMARPERPRVQWSDQWPRFRSWEYAATVVFDVGTLYYYRYRHIPAQAKWQGENLFDNGLRDWLRADTFDGRRRAGLISDVLALNRFIVPFAIDLPLVLLVHRQVGVTWQLLMMDLEAFAVAGFITNLLFYEAGRGRPDAADCRRDPNYDPLCPLGQNASFPSGHTMGLATAAGLTCIHHRYLPLYGHPAADAGACALMSLATVITGVTRIMSDRHYASDVLFGGTLGFAIGYGMPWALHYRTRGGHEGTSATPSTSVAFLPFAGPNQLGFGLVGAL